MAQEEISVPASSDRSSENYLINQVFSSARRQWWLFLLVVGVAGIAGYWYASKQKVAYESYLSFALDEGGSEGGSGSTALGLAAQFGLSVGAPQDVFTGDNILEIMESRRMIEATLLSVDTFDNTPMLLIEYYLQHEAEDSKMSKVHFTAGENRASFSYLQDSVLYATSLAFGKFFIVARRPDKKLNIFELMVTSHNEKFSKDFTDILIAETNRFYTEIRSKKSLGTLEILEKRLPDIKGKFDASVSNKAALQDANLNTAFENAQVPLLQQESNAQVYGTAYAEMVKNMEVARFEYLKSIPLMQVIDEANYPMKKILPGKSKTAIIFAAVAIIIFSLIYVVIIAFKVQGHRRT